MPNPKWDQHSILAELRRRGMTLTRLAEIHGLNASGFRRVWKYTNRKAEAAIASFLGVPVAELFPDRYPIRTSRVLSSKFQPGSASAEAIRLGKAA